MCRLHAYFGYLFFLNTEFKYLFWLLILLKYEKMTGRERELADLMEQRNVDILCLQETKWKGSKVRNIGGGCKLFWDRDSGDILG